LSLLVAIQHVLMALLALHSTVPVELLMLPLPMMKVCFVEGAFDSSCTLSDLSCRCMWVAVTLSVVWSSYSRSISVAPIVMIETKQGLDNVDAIVATKGL
jgi:hypothetical protein